MNLSVEAIKEVLAGDISSLIHAFIWAETPQGYTFWREQQKAGKLTVEGRAVLEKMLKEAENGKA